MLDVWWAKVRNEDDFKLILIFDNQNLTTFKPPGMAAGGWVLLQNVHLSLPFCSEIIDILVETEHLDDTFRLWVTTEVHEEFPIGLLQMAIKFTNEPPQGIRASLKRSYQVAFKSQFKHFSKFWFELLLPFAYTLSSISPFFIWTQMHAHGFQTKENQTRRFCIESMT